MKMFKRIGALALTLCCGAAVCLGLAALSDGVFRGYLESWPAMAQAEEKQPTEPPRETEQPNPSEGTLYWLVQPTAALTATPSPAPVAAPETENDVLQVEISVVFPDPNDAAALLNGIAQAAATVRPNQYLLKDTLWVEKAVIDPNALAVTPPFFDTLRKLYKSTTGIDLPAEGYAWRVFYNQGGDLCAQLLPQDMVLRQMNGETDFMEYRISFDAAANEAGFAAEGYAWSASVEGFRLTANQWSEKLYGDIREMLRGVCEPEERVITRIQAENGRLRYCLQGVNDPQQVDYLEYFVPGYDEDEDRAIREQAFRQLVNILYRCRDFLPVRNAEDNRDNLINRDVLLAELARITGREMTMTTMERSAAGLGDSGTCQAVPVNLPYDALPNGLKICMAWAAMEEPNGRTLDSLIFDSDGTVYACLGGHTEPSAPCAIGHSEWNDSLTLALDLDTD